MEAGGRGPVNLRVETGHLSVGIVRLAGIAIPAGYEPPEPPGVPGGIEGELAVARAMYRAIKQDPTRNRPSSEALLRRLTKGLGLPRVNALVDALNVCSVTLLLPFGCYDLAKTEGDIVFRVGREGDGYEGVGNRWVNVEGRYTVSDDRGPFGNPSMDSARTSITEATTDALVTVFAPPDHPHDRLDWIAERLIAAAGGTAAISVIRPE